MAKDKANTTQPLSESQVLKVSPQKSPAVDKNDQSVWKGLVVPAGEFAPAQAKRSSHGRTWAIVGVLGGAAVAGGALYAAGVFGSRGSSPPAAALPGSASAAVPLPPPPPVQDAAPVAVVPQDAAVAAPLDADAVSSAALPTKATKALKKRPPPKKRTH